jgi:hypothetical protein
MTSLSSREEVSIITGTDFNRGLLSSSAAPGSHPAGQFEIEQNNQGVAFRSHGIVSSTVEIIERFDAVANHDHLITDITSGKCRQGQLDIFAVIFHKQNWPRLNYHF